MHNTFSLRRSHQFWCLLRLPPIELTIREEVEPHAALLSIRDRGIGIPVGQQARIFGRFVRAENARASEIIGRFEGHDAGGLTYRRWRARSAQHIFLIPLFSVLTHPRYLPAYSLSGDLLILDFFERMSQVASTGFQVVEIV